MGRRGRPLILVALAALTFRERFRTILLPVSSTIKLDTENVSIPFTQKLTAKSSLEVVMRWGGGSSKGRAKAREHLGAPAQ